MWIERQLQQQSHMMPLMIMSMVGKNRSDGREGKGEGKDQN